MSAHGPITFAVLAGALVRTCKRCPQRIAFYTTGKGRNMPVDLPDHVPTHQGELFGETVELTSEPFHGESHFATCKFASEFRRPRKDVA